MADYTRGWRVGMPIHWPVTETQDGKLLVSKAPKVFERHIAEMVTRTNYELNARDEYIRELEKSREEILVNATSQASKLQERIVELECELLIFRSTKVRRATKRRLRIQQ